MNEFKENYKIGIIGKGNSTSIKLREVLDKIESGGYVSEPTMQKLDQLLTVAIHEKGLEEKLDAIRTSFDEELGD